MGLFSDETRDLLGSIHAESLRIMVTLRRDAGAAPAGPQPALLRLFDGGAARRRPGEGGAEVRIDAELRGRVGMDVQEEDRFTWGASLFRVIYVHPDRSVVTVAELEVVR